MANLTAEERLKMLELLSDEMNTATVLEQECVQEYTDLCRERDLAFAAYTTACRRVGDARKRLESSRVHLKLKRISQSSFLEMNKPPATSSRPLVPVEVPFDPTPMSAPKRKLEEVQQVLPLEAAKRPRLSAEDIEYFESDEFKNHLAACLEQSDIPTDNRAVECMYNDLLAPSCHSSYLSYLNSQK